MIMKFFLSIYSCQRNFFGKSANELIKTLRLEQPLFMYQSIFIKQFQSPVRRRDVGDPVFQSLRRSDVSRGLRDRWFLRNSNGRANHIVSNSREILLSPFQMNSLRLQSLILGGLHGLYNNRNLCEPCRFIVTPLRLRPRLLPFPAVQSLNTYDFFQLKGKVFELGSHSCMEWMQEREKPENKKIWGQHTI